MAFNGIPREELEAFLVQFVGRRVGSAVTDWTELATGELLLTHLQHLTATLGLPADLQASDLDLNPPGRDSKDTWPQIRRLLLKLWERKSFSLGQIDDLFPQSLTKDPVLSALLSFFFLSHLESFEEDVSIHQAQLFQKSCDQPSIETRLFWHLTSASLFSREGLLHRLVDSHLDKQARLISEKESLALLLEKTKLELAQLQTKLQKRPSIGRVDPGSTPDSDRGQGKEKEDEGEFRHQELKARECRGDSSHSLRSSKKAQEDEAGRLAKENWELSGRVRYYKEEVEKLLPLKETLGVLEPLAASYAGQFEDSERKNASLLKQIWELMGQLEAHEQDKAAGKAALDRAVRENALLSIQLEFVHSSLSHLESALGGSRVSGELEGVLQNLRKIAASAGATSSDGPIPVHAKLERRNFGRVLQQLSFEIDALWWTVRELALDRLCPK